MLYKKLSSGTDDETSYHKNFEPEPSFFWFTSENIKSSKPDSTTDNYLLSLLPKPYMKPLSVLTETLI